MFKIKLKWKSKGERKGKGKEESEKKEKKVKKRKVEEGLAVPFHQRGRGPCHRREASSK